MCISIENFIIHVILLFVHVFDIYSYSSNRNGQGGYNNQKCWLCDQEGHKARDCPNDQASMSSGPSKPGPSGPKPPPPPPGTDGGFATIV